MTSLRYAVELARNAEEALLLFDPKVHDAVVTEGAMSGMTGVEMAHIIRLRSPSTPVVLFAEQPPDDRSCLHHVVGGPFDPLRVKAAVDEVLRDRKR